MCSLVPERSDKVALSVLNYCATLIGVRGVLIYSRGVRSSLSMSKDVDFLLVLGGQLDKADMQKPWSKKITPCAIPRQKRL